MDELQECKYMVEANWRTFLTYAAEGSGELGKQCLLRFEQKVQKRAADMGADGKRWLALVEEQRGLIFDEYTAGPEALKRRLGVPDSQHEATRGSKALGFGDVAAREVVRATAWQSLSALFRWLR